VGINIAVGAVLITMVTLIAAQVPVASAGWRYGLVEASVGVFAAFTLDPAAVLFLVLATWMIVNGFLVDRSGDLSWHGSADVYRFLILVAVGVAGLGIGEISRRVSDLRERWRLGAVVEAISREFDEEGRHHA